MTGERHLIADPSRVDLSGTTCPAPRFVLQTSVERVGMVETHDETTICRTPWFVQWQSVAESIEVDNVHPVFCHYIFPVTDDLDLMVAAVGAIPRGMFNLLSGPDFGDELTRQVASGWPDIFDYLRASTEQRMDRRHFVVVKTINSVDWVLADPLRGPNRRDVSMGRREDLMMTALDAALRISAPWKTLPKYVTTLGGPDRLTRRLNAVSGLLGAVTDVGGGLTGSGSLTDLLDIARGLGDLPKLFKEFRD